MSLSAYVLSTRSLETIGEWQAAVDALGFKLTFEGQADERIEDLFGHLPVVWQGHEAGFECLPGDEDAAQDFVEDEEAARLGGPWTQILEISYVGLANIAGVAIAGAVYAHATGGIFWEGEEGVRVSAEEAVAYARRIETDILAALANENAEQPSA
ncbi:hypothetical protein [Methylobacterium sp. J-090]|uniref:hypothetical protein n=1 Tax=Methylobacterium sp. J-090 TaxID=2836666 RepID=UPI001FB97AEA|nr:hypothetical protein [Methylobacterium sp. J-090]MCJ2083029.1 hypothetical protein [Methylobacterium sp. J-090]